MRRLLLIATLFLAACAPTTDVVGHVVGGGPVGGHLSADVQFRQGGQIVASTTAAPSGTFELRLLPGTYDVVVTKFEGGCPGTHHVTVQGSRQEFSIICNLAA
jgi:hypothetical protein